MKGMRVWDVCAALRLHFKAPAPASVRGEMKGQRRGAELKYRNSMLCFCLSLFLLTLPDLGFKPNLTNNFLFTIRNVFLGTWGCHHDVTMRLKPFFSYTVG